MKNNFDGLHDQIMGAENRMTLTPQGSGGYNHNPDTLAPRKTSMRPQTAAQHAATVRAGKASAMKRKVAAGKPVLPL